MRKPANAAVVFSNVTVLKVLSEGLAYKDVEFI